MNIEEIKKEFGDCDWMRAFLNGYAVDAILWLMYRVEKLEQCVCKKYDESAVSEIMNGFIEDKGDETMLVETCGANQVKEGQVTQELTKAENAFSRLEATIDKLEKQLSQVLHPTESLTPKPMEAKEAKCALVALASRIENHYLLLQTLGTSIEEMLERLEIR